MSQEPSGGRAIVSSGLNLWLPLADSSTMPDLLFKLQQQRLTLDKYLSELNHIHYARFVPAPKLAKIGDKLIDPPACKGEGLALQVITEFDGDFDAYVMDFAMTIKAQFNLILSYVEQWPTDPLTGASLKVEDDPAYFLKFIKQRDLGFFELGQGPIRTFAAYPNMTVIDVIGASGFAADPAPSQLATPVAVPPANVQANILRGIGARHGWHALLRITDPAQAGTLLQELRAPAAGLPQLTSDADWPLPGGELPDYWLTLGISYAGLLKLGISPADAQALRDAHAEFTRGPAHYDTALAVGDIDASQPANWQVGGDRPVDLMLSLYANAPAALALHAATLSNRCTALGLEEVCTPWITEGLPKGNEHFGYADNVSQPRIATLPAPVAGPPSLAPDARVGAFLLGSGYANAYGGRDNLGGLSAALAQDGSFAALRILEQDVPAFESLLDTAGAKHQVDREWVAAKLMGRWRDGTPLSLSPTRSGLVPAYRDDFNYLPSEQHPDVHDDGQGLRCPVGAHTRRMNPRNSRVAGLPHSRRLIRRGMPYGPVYEAGSEDAAKPRGLFGLFLCADLKRQYEFILREWAQGDTATTGIAGQQDPFLGAQCPLRPGQRMSGQFSIPMADRPPIVLDMPRLVKTVGSVYFFMPGLPAVDHLADQAVKSGGVASSAAPAANPDTATSSGFVVDPATFDPRDPGFRADPFPTYAWFRANQPVARLPTMGNSVWVFGAAQVDQIATDQLNFHKRKDEFLDVPKGLLSMDGDAHAACRAAMDQIFGQVLTAIGPTIAPRVRRIYALHCQGKGGSTPLDWVDAFARPLAEQVLLGLLGVEVPDAAPLTALVRQMLAMATPTDDPAVRGRIKLLQSRFAEEFTELKAKKKIKAGLIGLIAQMPGPYDEDSNKKTNGASALEVEQLTNITTLFMTGILPVQWFIPLAIWRLLENDGALLAQLKADPLISHADAVTELLRYDMPTPTSNRFAVANVLIDGVTYPAGTRFMVVWASANRDSNATFPDADKIDFTRSPKSYRWAFGAPLPNQHNCLGNKLLYAIMEPVIELLRTVEPTPRLPAGFHPVWAAGAMFRPMAELPIHC